MRDIPANVLDYEEARRSFKLDVPEYFNFALDVVDKWAEEHTKLALISVDSSGESGQKHTFWELKVLSNRFANLLMSLGVSKGDRAFLMVPRIPEWYIAVLGMIKLGVVPMPATTLCTAHDIEYRINRAEASLAIIDVENAAKLAEVMDNCPSLKDVIVVNGEVAEHGKNWVSYDEEMPKMSGRLDGVKQTRSDDPLLIYFTSGTVGPPKMVLHTQASYGMGHASGIKIWQDTKPTDIQWAIADTGWAKTAYGKLFGQWTHGAAVLQHNAVGRFDPDLTLRIIEKYGVTTFCAPPTGYRMLVLEDLKKYDLSNVRHCTGAGEPLNPEVMKTWEEGTGLNIYDGYGQTETTLLAANYRCVPIKPGSMGKPAPGVHVSIVDEDGNELPPGEEGQIAVKVKPHSPVGMLKEYWKDPEATANAFRGDWYFTGDKAYKDEDGYLWFVGRADDVIISAGYRIGPFEVESALVEHPAVAESAVVASPDEMRGNIVKAFIILAPGYTPSEELTKSIQEHVRQVTAPFKYPRVIDYVSELPKTISGKIRRVELRDMERKGTA